MNGGSIVTRWLIALALMLSFAAPASAAGEQRAARAWVTNEAGLALIEKSEGLRLQAYNGGNAWRIGYGHSTNVTKGQSITAVQAVAFLQADVKACETAIGQLVHVPVTENEFSALVSLCFSTGAYSLRKATVISRLNAGDRVGAANGFLLWVKAGGKSVAHLAVRRTAERDLFLK
jgi:lysozyme